MSSKGPGNLLMSLSSLVSAPTCCRLLCCQMLHEPFVLLTADCLLQERVRGQQYDELIDELIGALRERYGAGLIVHWEDFNVRNSFRLLDKYVDQV